MRFSWLFLCVLALLLEGCVSSVPATVTQRDIKLAEPALTIRSSQTQEAKSTNSEMTQSSATAVSYPVTADGQSAAPTAKPVEVPPGYHQVQRGENLLRISLEAGQYYRDVAAWNNIDDPNVLQAGQVIRVVPPEAEKPAKPVSKPSAKVDTKPAIAVAPKPMTSSKPALVEDSVGGSALTWAWPGKGNVIAAFAEGSNKGINLSGKLGDPVLAAADGKVVYAGTGLRGYGKLVIVKHDSMYLTAYAHNNEILVKEGQSVTRGQKLAELGSTDTDKPMLHFELRKQGKPVDPLAYLPAK